MSEQPQKPNTEETPPWPTSEPDDTEPTPERQAELRAAYDNNVATGRPPYAGVELHTRGELKWVLRERGWSEDPDRRAEFIDLRESGLSRTVFGNVKLSLANLSGAVVAGSNLSGAELTGANLSDVFVTYCDLSDANLGVANLSGAILGDTTLSGADLSAANLSGAIVGYDLADVNLTGARMSGTTMLGSFASPMSLDERTRLLDVAWNGAILSSVRWEQVSRLGDEADIKVASTRKERVEALQNAARAYRGLAKALQAQGLTIQALKFRTREQQLERKSLFWSFKPGQWFFSWLLNIVAGYGDRPGRAVVCYLGVVSFFAATYYAITNGLLGIASQSAHLRWYEALVLSISSFHGRGFFPAVPS